MNIVFWSIIFLFVGAFWQIIDSILGVKVFRIWYNLTHEEPLLPEIRRGFITKRGSKANTFWAFIGSSVLCLLFMFRGDASSFTKMMLWLLGIPIIMIGFYFGGPNLKKLWKNRDSFFQKIDKIEKGDVVARGQFKKMVLGVRDFFSGLFRSVTLTHNRPVSKKPDIATKELSVPEEVGETSSTKVNIAPNAISSPGVHIEVKEKDQIPTAEDPREVIRRYTERAKE